MVKSTTFFLSDKFFLVFYFKEFNIIFAGSINQHREIAVY